MWTDNTTNFKTSYPSPKAIALSVAGTTKESVFHCLKAGSAFSPPHQQNVSNMKLSLIDSNILTKSVPDKKLWLLPAVRSPSLLEVPEIARALLFCQNKERREKRCKPVPCDRKTSQANQDTVRTKAGTWKGITHIISGMTFQISSCSRSKMESIFV